jgi:hypothetical protein
MIRWSRHRFEVLDIQVRGGSPEHYFHFFLGILVPLINHLVNSRGRPFYFVRSCAPMNRIWEELNLDNIAIVDKTSIPQLGRHFPKITLHGFDAAPYYDSDVFMRVRQFLFGKFGMPNPWGESTKAPSGILLVDRGPGDPYYNSSLAEIKTSAKQRRSIPNFNTLADAVRSLEPSAKAIRLEKTSLKNQARLFKNAKIVVMQHGAAMTNVFWMRPGSRVIEIGPLQEWPNFIQLCQIFGVHREIVPQQTPHEPVNVDEITAAVSRAIQKGEGA